MDDEEVIASHGVLAEQHEKPDDLLDNYFLLGEDDFEVGYDFLCKTEKMITDPSRNECRAHHFAHVYYAYRVLGAGGIDAYCPEAGKIRVRTS